MFFQSHSTSFLSHPFFGSLAIIFLCFLLDLLNMHACLAYAQDPFYTIHVSSNRIHKNATNEVSRLESLGLKAFCRYESVEGKGKWDKVMAEILRRREIISCFDIAVIEEAKGNLGDKDEKLTAASLSQETNKKDWQQLISIHGYVKNETAYRTHSPSEFTKAKNIFFASTEGKLSPSLGYKISGRAYYDAVFDLTDTYTEDVEDDQEDEVELRDTYLDFSSGNFDVRLGKQQIVWGEAVGLFFADVVNPKDLREFILPDFNEIRIPMWAVNTEYYMGENYFQLVWIPVLKFNELGVPGSEFEFATPAVPYGTSVNYKSKKKPSDNLKNSEYGIRFSRLIAGWDLSAFWFHGYDYFPVLFRTIDIDPLTSGINITVRPEYRRLNIFGGTFSKEVKDAIFKGEFIYNRGKYFFASDLSDTDGVIKRDFLDYLLGVDYTFFQKIDTNFQFMQRIIFNHCESMIDDRTKTSFSIWLKTGFFDNRLEPEVFFVSSLRKINLMVRPRITYKINDNWTGVLGADIFGGDHDTDFGQFDTKDRVYIELRYDF